MADRRDVTRMPALAAALVLAVALGGGSVAAGGQGQPCEVIPMPCTFEGRPFTLEVIDAETRQPLADVHALAEWPMVGAGGRRNGPLMVREALSGADGLLSFEGWGPIEGPWTGLVIGSDPVVTLFKSGYKTMWLNNGYQTPSQERERVRRFVGKDSTVALEPFRGTPEQWLQQLRRVWLGAAVPRNDDDTLRFRDAYLNRLRLVSAERHRLSERHQAVGQFFWHVDRSLRVLEEGHK